jgi:hypothetical protein
VRHMKRAESPRARSILPGCLFSPMPSKTIPSELAADRSPKRGTRSGSKLRMPSPLSTRDTVPSNQDSETEAYVFLREYLSRAGFSLRRDVCSYKSSSLAFKLAHP